MKNTLKRIGLGLGILSASALPFLAGAQTFDIPATTTNALTANVTSQISQPGVFGLIVLAVGIPLFFYVVHQVMGLVPKGRAKKH